LASGGFGYFISDPMNHERTDPMGIGASIVLIAAGAILRFAVTLDTTFGSTRVNWNVVGDVLMIVGVIGLLISLIWLAAAARRGNDVYVDRGDRPYTP
jgi:hypothetical protein